MACVCVCVYLCETELEEGMMINDRADLEKDRLPVGQMTGDGGMGGGGGGTEWRGGQWATELLILANDC